MIYGKPSNTGITIEGPPFTLLKTKLLLIPAWFTDWSAYRPAPVIVKKNVISLKKFKSNNVNLDVDKINFRKANFRARNLATPLLHNNSYHNANTLSNPTRICWVRLPFLDYISFAIGKILRFLYVSVILLFLVFKNSVRCFLLLLQARFCACSNK